MAGGKNIGGPIATDAQGFVRNTCDTQAHARIQGAHARCPRAGKDEANGEGVDFSQPAKSLQISSSTESLPSKRRQRRSKRPTKHSPPAIPIILAALLSAAALQPAGDGGKEVYHCICARGEAIQYEPCCWEEFSSQYVNRSAHWESDTCSEWDEFNQEEDPAFSAEFLTLIVRILFIFMEFGSRPLKNAKKILSCGFICLWLYHYRFGSSVFSFTSRMSKMKMVDGNVAAENATFVVFFLLLRLALKLAELLNLFKTWKRLRIVKLLKLAKLAKLVKWVMLGKLSVRSVMKVVRYFKLLKLLKVSRKTKKLLNKRHYKSFKIFKAFKVIKVIKLAVVVFCIDGALVPAWAWPWGGGICPHLPI